MSDNVNVTAGTGTVIATDQVGTDHYQKIKIADGTTDGDTMAVVGVNGLEVEVKAAPAIVLGAGSAAIGKLAANSGVDIGDVDVTSLPTLPAGTNAIGKLAANSGVDIGDVDVTSITGVTMSNAGMQITGDEAADAADAGNPVKVGGKAFNQDGTAPGTAVAENDRSNFITDVYGRQFVETSHPNLWSVSADYAEAQTNTSVKATPGAGLSLYITDIMISNGAVAGNVTLLDGSGGTVLWEIYPAINGGCVSNLKTPIKLTANTALCITSTDCTTHSVTVSGFIAP